MSKLITNTVRHVDGTADNITLDSSQNVTVEGNLTVDGTSTLTGQLKTNALRHTGASSDAVTLATDGTCTAKITNNLSNRNLIINGAMQVSQRGTSQSYAHDGTTQGYSLDRWMFYSSATDEWDWVISQDSSGPTGFSKSLKITTGTAESAVAADEYAYLNTRLEGIDLQSLGYGAGTAKAATLSFWVKSSITGTFGFTIYRGDTQDRVCNIPYAISSANTWEKKTISIPADTSDGITDDNNARMRVTWAILAGTNFTSSGASSSWADYSSSGQYLAGHAQNGVATTGSATWYLTGVQLEVGDVATDFEHRSYGDEYLRCCRYYYRHTRPGKTYAAIGSAQMYSDTAALGVVFFPTEMRYLPTVDSVTGTDYYQVVAGGDVDSCDRIILEDSNDTCCGIRIDTNLSISSSQGRGVYARLANTSSGYLSFSAEL